ncbi:hypothetical protein BHM03_00002976 [Ensete ventricosum]|nr:hypothetical protein BHM03_00002976 [Ensete ventricosum]
MCNLGPYAGKQICTVNLGLHHGFQFRNTHPWPNWFFFPLFFFLPPSSDIAQNRPLTVEINRYHPIAAGDDRNRLLPVTYISGDIYMNHGSPPWWSFNVSNTLDVEECNGLTGPMAVVVSEETPRTFFFGCRLIAICENIYTARAEGELEVEEVLYWTLVKIYRSPHMLLEYTKSD